MTQYWRNYAANEYSGDQPPQKLVDFMMEQQKFTIALAEGSIKPPVSQYSDDLIFGLRHVVAQFKGLIDGYMQRAKRDNIPQALDEVDLFLLNSVGDLESLNSIEKGPAVDISMPDSDLGRYLDCSGYVGPIQKGSESYKASAQGGDIAVLHSTWRSYYAMMRVAAVWDFPFAPAKVVAASSSPGFLHSKDDFYVSGGEGRLVVFETTNAVFNKTLAAQVSPHTLLTWQRAAAAMMVATSGEHWTGVFSLLNSGTYNSQWVVVDGKLVAQAQAEAESKQVLASEQASTANSLPAALPDNTLWVLEQIPTYVWRADMTSKMASMGYWPSYNIPYNEKVYVMSGYPAQAAKNPGYGYNTTGRSRIFARNSSTATTMDDVMRLARYNDYESDPLSGGDPVLGAVAARGDLQAGSKATPFGAVDSKTVSAGDLGATGNAELHFISGPTTDQQTPFSFTPEFSGVVRDGVPDRWDFDWVSFPLQRR